MAEESKPVEVSRRIEAPATLIFKVLANPQRHVDFDGSDMLRGAVLDRPISDVGDTFTMKMHRRETTTSCSTTWWSSSQIGTYFGNRLPETLLGLRVMIHPKSASLQATAGATSSLRTVTMPPSSRRYLTMAPVTEETRQSLLHDGGAWINGTNSVLESMTASLERLEKISTE